MKYFGVADIVLPLNRHSGAGQSEKPGISAPRAGSFWCKSHRAVAYSQIARLSTCERPDHEVRPLLTTNAALRNQLGQHFLPSGPRWYPGGHARPTAIGWQ